MTNQPPIKPIPKWAKLIKTERKRLGLSQQMFGHMFGVSHVAVGYWERGETDPPGSVTYYLYERKVGKREQPTDTLQ